MALLTQIAIKRGFPQLHLKDLGTFFLDYQHLFPTRRLSASKYQETIAQLQQQNLFFIEKGRNILQTYARIAAAATLPAVFQTGHYLEQLRWRIGNPNTCLDPSPPLVELLEYQQQINALFTRIVQENQQQCHNQPQAQITKKLNQRLRSLEAHLQRNSLPENYLDQELLRALSQLPRRRGISTNFNQGLELLVNQEHISITHPLSAAELRNQKWLLIDIEKPLYGEEDEEISWITLACPQLKIKEVHTLRKTSFAEHQGYHIIQHSSEETLLECLIYHINHDLNPEIISAHNAPYNLLEIRAALEKNRVDKKDFYPKKEVAKKFFERIRIDRLQVVDLLKYAQLAFRFLPDQKLETVARHVLGENSFKKGLNYDQLRSLERSAKEHQNLSAANQLAVYAIEDVLVMEQILEKISLPQALAPICTYFNLELCRALHNPASVENLRRRRYFENVGTHLEDFTHFSKKIRKMREKLQQQVKTHKLELISQALNFPLQPGFHQQTTLAYLPWGDYLRNILAGAYPELNLFFQEKYSHLDNQELQYIQSQYLDSFLEEIWIDYLDFQNNPLSQDYKRRIFIGRHKTKPSAFQELLEQKVDMVSRFIQNHQLKVIQTDGNYFFFQGALPQGRRPPFLLLAQTDLLLTANQRPIYRLGSKYAQIRIKRKPYKNHPVFEMQLFKQFLDLVFSQKPQEALQFVRQQEELLLSGKIDPLNLVYWNRKRDLYSGYEEGLSQKTFFYYQQIPPFDADMERGFPFIVFIQNNKEKKAYFYRDDDFRPDFAAYHQKIFGPQSLLTSMVAAIRQQAAAIGQPFSQT